MDNIKKRKILCREFLKSGSGVCLDKNCNDFHPFTVCYHEKSCIRKKCWFRHNKTWYNNSTNSCIIIDNEEKENNIKYLELWTKYPENFNIIENNDKKNKNNFNQINARNIIPSDIDIKFLNKTAETIIKNNFYMFG